MQKLLLFAFFLTLYSDFAFAQLAKLDTNELKVLKEIWGKLGLAGRKEWDFDKDPCSDEGNWVYYVSCDCSFEHNTTCRVNGIYIKGQNVSTTLPSEFAKLPYLQSVDLNLNYLSGTVPSEWATMHLRTLSLSENRLSGAFPTALTKITTLKDLDIDGNRFSGHIPKDIGNLKNLEKLTLSSNDFTGQLPVALAKLTNLTSLRISDNNFTGKIPYYISRWQQLESFLKIFIGGNNAGYLHIQGCSFEGPIPSSISVLTRMNDLRISELKGVPSTFPPLKKMTQLQILDLSFNKLTGKIPSSFSLLANVKYIYLTKNNLTGPMPEWVLSSTSNVDVSYNNFTWDDASGPKACEQGKINMVESYSSSTHKQNKIPTCLRKDFPCTKSNSHQVRSLHINCGGEEVNINTIKYEADTQREGASSHYFNGNWAFSSTGNFINEDDNSGVYILSNTSNLHSIPTSDTKLYRRARTAAISLTYYGLCLANGMYRVRLHFAEIVFTQDHSYNSLGRRVFDVYVQGELKQKDFNIAKEAGGTGRAIIKSYLVDVKNNTLKIQLYWAGKGTTQIPTIGNYGPIISAISVDRHIES